MNIEELIDTMDTAAQREAFDLLWRRLSGETDGLPSPSWHGEVLRHREEFPSERPKMSVAESRAEVKRMIDERRSS